MLEAADWLKALQRFGVKPRIDIWDLLHDAYSAPDRHYHDLSHIESCLDLLERQSEYAERPEEIALALWFHDAVYDTRASDNEAASARWAEEYLRDEGGDAAGIERIKSMILATEFHGDAEGDIAIMVDIDLSILGALDETFDAYDAAIRREYSWVPESDYRAGRRAVLRSFADREFIFHTAVMRQSHEAAARRNVERALARL